MKRFIILISFLLSFLSVYSQSVPKGDRIARMDTVYVSQDGVFRTMDNYITNHLGDIQQFSDTAAIKNFSADSVGTLVSLDKIYSDGTGGGLFVWKTSGTAHPMNVFAATGGYWTRVATYPENYTSANRPSPASNRDKGRIVYNTTKNKFQMWHGTSWKTYIDSSEVQSLIDASVGSRAANSLSHEFIWNETDTRTDTLNDNIGTIITTEVGETWTGGSEPHPGRSWSYPSDGMVYAANRFISDANESGLDLDSSKTIEFGVFFSTPYGAQDGNLESLFSKGIVGSSSLNYHVYRRASDGYLSFDYYNGSLRSVIDSSSVLERNTWYSIAIVISASADSIHFYRNGVNTWNKPLPATLPTNSTALIIGGSHNGSIDQSFFGAMKFWRKYDKIMNSTEIAYNYSVDVKDYLASTTFQSYTEEDDFFAATQVQYPDSGATTKRPVLYAGLYDSVDDVWRIFFYEKTDRTLRMATSTDSLATLNTSTKIDTLAAVPALYYDAAGDTLWLYAQDWVNLGAGDSTILTWHSVDSGATWSAKDTAWTGIPTGGSSAQGVLDPYVFKSGSTYYMAIANNQRLFLLSSTKPGTGYTEVGIMDITAESGQENVLEGPTIEQIGSTWYCYYSVAGARRVARWATNTSLQINNWSVQDYPIQYQNGYKRVSGWAITLPRPVVFLGTNPMDSNYNYYVVSAADGSDRTGGLENFYRLVLLKLRNDNGSRVFIDNIQQ